MEGRRIFREHSLEKISSPDQLDRLLRIVRPQSWILVSSLGIGLLLALVWSIFGRIPITASGSAVLIRPKQVVSFHSPTSGAVRSIVVSIGDLVGEGDLLATLHLPALEKELEQEEAKLEQFNERTDELTDLEEELAEKELEYLEVQRDLLEERIESVRAAAERYKAANHEYIRQQETNLATARSLSEELGAALSKRYQSSLNLKGEGLTTDDRHIAVQNDVITNRLRLAELEVEQQQLALHANTVQDSYDKQMDLVKDLSFQRNTIELRVMEIARQLRTEALQNTSAIQEIERRIEQLRGHLGNEGHVVSKHAGEILEITAAVGQHVAIGQVIGKMEKEDPDADLKALAYFRVKDGKKITTKLKIRVSPATVERERFGAIVGRVVRVSDYPVTVDAAANQIGDHEMALSLLAGQSRIEVLADLNTDQHSFSGFEWTSGNGPGGLSITAGTTAVVRVTIEERAPITLLLPFLRGFAGI